MDEKSDIKLRDLSNEQVETDRLFLVPVSMDYTETMLQELTDEVTKYMAIYSPKSIDEEITFVNKALDKMSQGTDLSLMILDKDTKEYLGGVTIRHLDSSTPDMGVWVKKSAQGKKIGREAVTGLKNWADQNLDFDYITYHVDKDNISSRKIAESLGGVIVSSGIKIMPWGKQLDEVVYHIPKAE